jgi:hypothetical protein
MPTLSETARQTQTLVAKPQGPPSFVPAPILISAILAIHFTESFSFQAGKKSASEFF